MNIRPGDTFIGEVTNVRPLTWGPERAQQCIKIITVAFELPHKVRPYFATISWNVAKKGREPMAGEHVEIVFIKPPLHLMHGNCAAGKFRATRIINKETNTMAMSHDRVKFFIGPKYLQLDEFYDVLHKAFGIDPIDTRQLYRNRDGFKIVCRPSQFARFLIYRNNAGITNGFMDLRPDLIEAPRSIDAVELLAETAGVSRTNAVKVAEALGFTPKSIMNYLKPDPNILAKSVEIDVSGNPHDHG